MDQEKLAALIVRSWTKPKTKSEVLPYRKAITELLALCHDSPSMFNSLVLGRSPFWSRQNEMSDLVMNNQISIICSGNAIGKTYWIAGLCFWYLLTNPDSLVITTSPTYNQLNNSLWKNIRDTFENSRVPLGGEIVKSPNLAYRLGSSWEMIGLTSTSTEKLSGIRSKTGKTLICVDEGSGLSDEIADAINSISADKIVMIGNPLRAEGYFYDLWNKAQKGEPGFGSLKVTSLESPDIDEEQSTRGMACQSWLRNNRVIYGDKSAYWVSHILAEFPDSVAETLIPRSWLDLCEAASHVPGGRKRMGVDLALGVGGDYSTIIIRDDNGIILLERSNTWKLEDTARKVDQLMRQYNIESKYVIFDSNGPGNDFGNRLLAYGIRGVKEFVGSRNSGSSASRYKNDRTAAAFAMRRRLDPDRLLGVPLKDEDPQKPNQFYISGEHLRILRPQLQALLLKNADENKVALIPKSEVQEKLNESPDASDALAMSFFYTDNYLERSK